MSRTPRRCVASLYRKWMSVADVGVSLEVQGNFAYSSSRKSSRIFLKDCCFFVSERLPEWKKLELRDKRSAESVKFRDLYPGVKISWQEGTEFFFFPNR